MTLVVYDLKVLILVVEYRRRTTPDDKLGRGIRLARKLCVGLLEVIHVQVTVTARPNEVPQVKIALLRKHVREQRVGGNIERHAQKQIRASLIQLARQAVVSHVKLKECVTRQQCHAVELPDVPCADDNPPRVGVLAQTL